MKKIKNTSIKIGSISAEVELYELNEKDIVENLSRVYVVVVDENGKVPLIYNSKRDIWGFPGGHTEEDESITETANRESIEEIKKSIQGCEQKFLMINKIDAIKKENQVICFAKIGEDSEEYTDENESVKKIIYTPIDEIISKIGNKDFWEPILEEFRKWI